MSISRRDLKMWIGHYFSNLDVSLWRLELVSLQSGNPMSRRSSRLCICQPERSGNWNVKSDLCLFTFVTAGVTLGLSQIFTTKIKSEPAWHNSVNFAGNPIYNWKRTWKMNKSYRRDIKIRVFCRKISTFSLTSPLFMAAVLIPTLNTHQGRLSPGKRCCLVKLLCLLKSVGCPAPSLLHLFNSDEGFSNELAPVQYLYHKNITVKRILHTKYCRSGRCISWPSWTGTCQALSQPTSWTTSWRWVPSYYWLMNSPNRALLLAVTYP